MARFNNSVNIIKTTTTASKLQPRDLKITFTETQWCPLYTQCKSIVSRAENMNIKSQKESWE